MKKITHLQLVALAMLFACQYYSQTVKYSFSEEFKTIDGHGDMGFYQIDKNLFAEVYYRHEDDMIFQIYDQKFKKIKKQEIVKINKKEKYVNEGLFCVKNDFFWLYSTWIKKEKKEELWAVPLNKETFKLDKSPIKLSESTKLSSMRGYNKYTFDYANDSAMMLMTYRKIPKEKKDRLNKDVIGFNLYDNKMNAIYAHEIVMPYTEADMDILDKEIDSRGNIYLLASVKLNNSIDGEKKENRGLYRYDLMRVDQKRNEMQSIKISLDDKFVRNAVLSEDLTGSLIITGYYSNKRGSGADGAYIIRLEYNENNSVKKLNTTYCEFPKEVLQSYVSERTKRRMEKKDRDDDLEAENLELRKIVFDTEGGITIVGEEHFIVTHTSRSSNGSSTTSYTYYYNSILVLKVNKEGKTEWCSKIPKFQKGSGNADLGFHLHTYKGNVYFFYLDNEKNENLPLDKIPALHLSGRGGFLMCVKVDSQGNMTKEKIFDVRKEEVFISPRSFDSVGDNLIVDRLRESRKSSKVFRLEILD